MCRKKTTQGLCCICFAFGVMVGYALDSWWLSSCGGLGLLLFGMLLLKQH